MPGSEKSHKILVRRKTRHPERVQNRNRGRHQLGQSFGNIFSQFQLFFLQYFHHLVEQGASSEKLKFRIGPFFAFFHFSNSDPSEGAVSSESPEHQLLCPVEEFWRFDLPGTLTSGKYLSATSLKLWFSNEMAASRRMQISSISEFPAAASI